MPNINFPANPTQGQEFTFNKFKYIYNSNRWQSARNDSSADLDNFIKDLGAPDSKVVIAGVEAKDFIDQKDGIPATAVVWFPSREANHEGYIPADGQLLNRALYPSLWEAVRDRKVPVTVDDQDWLNNPNFRGCYSPGDGSTTFRVPDYNGKVTNSLGSAFLRGDGLNAGEIGHVQGDAIRNITAGIGYLTADYGVVSPRATSGAFSPHGSGTTTLAGGSSSTIDSLYGITFDASRVVPIAEENRPVNIAGVWMIKAFSYVENEGVIDAGHLVTALAEVDSKVTQALENRMSITNPVAKETTPYGLSDFNVPRTATVRESPNWFISHDALRFMDGESLYRAATNNASYGQTGVIDWAWISKFKFDVRLEVTAPSLSLWQHVYSFTVDSLVQTNAHDLYAYPSNFLCHAGFGARGAIMHRLIPGTENNGLPYFELHLPGGLNLRDAADKEVRVQIVATRLWG